MARNSAKNHTQPEQAIPVGDPSGKARRMSSGNVVRRAAWGVFFIAKLRGRGRLEGTKRPLIAQYAGQTGGTNLRDLQPR